MATISINKLKLSTIIGTKEKERVEKQEVFIDLSFIYDSTKAQKSDVLDDTVDYDALIEKISSHAEKTSFFLIEKLASFILDVLMENKKILSSAVTIYKPNAIPMSESVSVQLSRER